MYGLWAPPVTYTSSDVTARSATSIGRTTVAGETSMRSITPNTIDDRYVIAMRPDWNHTAERTGSPPCASTHTDNPITTEITMTRSSSTRVTRRRVSDGPMAGRPTSESPGVGASGS